MKASTGDRRAARLALLLVLLVSTFAVPAGAHDVLPPGANVSDSYGKIPWHFEANGGQWDPAVRFGARGRGFSALVTQSELLLSVESPDEIAAVTGAAADSAPRRSSLIRLQLVGASASGSVDGLEPLPGKVNYYVGGDAARWRNDLPIYARVRHRGVYPGIDLVLHGDKRQLEFDFVVAPGSDPRSIRLHVDGADSVADDAGNLVLHTAAGDVRLAQPQVFQLTRKGKRQVAARYRERAPLEYGFDIGKYDRRLPLIIDPLVLIYSTYLGGFSDDGNEAIFALAVTPSAYAYVTGWTASMTFPLAGTPIQSMYVGGTHDTFITKFAPNGTLVFSTYFGGTLDDNAEAIAVDSSGVAYVGGNTASTDLPMLNAYQPMFAGGRDAWLARIGPTGTLLSSTYFGGDGSDRIRDIAVRSGSPPSPSLMMIPPLVAFTGDTNSTNLPTVNPYQASRSGAGDAFVATMNPQLAPASQLTYSTYLGGTGQEDSGRGIAIDSGMRLLVVAGNTTTKDFPIANAYQPNLAGGREGFVAKIDPSVAPAAQLVYSTFLGGTGFDEVLGLAVDSLDSAYVAGSTASSDFPTANPLQGTIAGGLDAFVAVFDSSGANLTFGTFFGGTGDEEGHEIAVDASFNIYLAGATDSADLPQLNQFPSLNTGSSLDVYLTKIGAAGDLVYSTKIGGADTDQVYGIARDGFGDVYLAGATASHVFPVKQAFQPFLKGIFDGFVTRIREQGSDPGIAVDPDVTNVPVQQFGTSQYTITNRGLAAAEDVELVVSMRGAEFVLADVSPSTGRCKVNRSERGFTCELGTVGPGMQVGVEVIIEPLTQKPPEIVSTAHVRHKGKELNPADNRAVQTISVR